MSNYVKVPYAELFQRAARIRHEADIIRNELHRLNESVESIQWMGQRADRFFTSWNETRPDMEHWISILEKFADDLEEQARRMQAADESY